jgi:hypothetical protein
MEAGTGGLLRRNKKSHSANPKCIWRGGVVGIFRQSLRTNLLEVCFVCCTCGEWKSGTGPPGHTANPPNRTANTDPIRNTTGLDGQKAGMMNTAKVEQMKLRLATNTRQRRAEALGALAELASLSDFLIPFIKDSNGEPENGWKPNLREANRLVLLMYWKTVRVHDVLTGTDTDGTDQEIAHFEVDY